MNILFQGSVKKMDLADFFQKMAMLINAGYDICSACELIAAKGHNKKDHSADKIRIIANMLLPDLREGFSLNQAMSRYPNLFDAYSNQIKVGETSGNTSDVLYRICDQIRNGNNLSAKVKSAMIYPITVIFIVIVAGWYLFTQIMPQMLEMVSELTDSESIPWSTKLIMDIGNWFSRYGLRLAIIILLVVVIIAIYSSTIGKRTMSRLVVHIPLIGKIIQNTNMATYFINWEHMVSSGAEMSVALKSATESISNLDMRIHFENAQLDYQNNGVSVSESFQYIEYVREMEVQTIAIAINTGDISNALKLLASDREFEAEKSINRLTAAINPILLAIVGVVVGIFVMAVYAPIINVTSSLN